MGFRPFLHGVVVLYLKFFSFLHDCCISVRSLESLAVVCDFYGHHSYVL